MNHDKNTVTPPSIWDDNPFQDIDNVMTLDVLENKLFTFYENYNQPASISIKKLLKATSAFLYATTPEYGFSESSADAKTHHDLEVLFKNITNSFKIAENDATEKFDISSGKLILLSAIDYCKKFIEMRLNSLQQLPNNKFYIFYQKHCSELQTLLSLSETPRYRC